MQFLRTLFEPLLPAFFFERTFFQVELWQWVISVVAITFAYLLSLACARVSVLIARQMLIRRIHGFDTHSLLATYKPLRLIFSVFFIALFLPFLDLSKYPAEIISTTLKIVIKFGFAWLSLGVFDVGMIWLTHRVLQKGRSTFLSALPLMRRVGKTIIVILAMLIILQHLTDVTALLAGLGVGGIAIALASQKTLENLVGGLMIILDQPIQVGQECKFSGYQGIVEDIGLRSTRIRTSERSVVSVPNSELSQMHLENLTLRDRLRITANFGLRYETTPEQTRHVLIGIRKILYAHPKIDRDPARVRLVNFGMQSLEIEMVAYVLTNSHSEYLAVKEDILLRAMEVIRSSGTSFGIPSSVLYKSEHEFLDDQARIEAEKEVFNLRRNHQLPMPEFSDSQILALDDTIDYPPTGTANSDPEARYL